MTGNFAADGFRLRNGGWSQKCWVYPFQAVHAVVLAATAAEGVPPVPATSPDPPGFLTMDTAVSRGGVLRQELKYI